MHLHSSFDTDSSCQDVELSRLIANNVRTRVFIYIYARIEIPYLRYGYFDVEYRLMKLSGNSRARYAVMRTMRRSSNIYQPHGILQ